MSGLSMSIKVKIFSALKKHKLAAIITSVLVIILGYYAYGKFFSTEDEIKYVLGKVEKGTLIASVSGSGQISASNQIDLKPKAAGDVLVIYVKNGQDVKSGQILFQLDAREAQKALRDAEVNLESARLALEKLKQPADALSLLQAENSLSQAKESKLNAESDLKKAYDDGYTAISNAFLDLPQGMSGLQDVLFGTVLSSGGQPNYAYYADSIKNYDERALRFSQDSVDTYQKARKEYDQNFADYKAVSRFSDVAVIESLVGQTYMTAKSVSEAIRSASNLIQFYQDKLGEHNVKPNVSSDSHLTTLSGYTGKVNTHLANLLSIKTTIQGDRDAIINAQRSIEEKTESLAKLKRGTNPLDIESQELAVKQRENSLLDAREKLSDYYVRASFDGVVAKLNVKKFDPVSSATVVATLITKQKIAEISFNEIDVARAAVEQKSTLTFDALEGLSITGRVAEIDTVGTVTQGVVNYNVKIVFDTQDDRIKPGMSVSASVINNVKQNVLLVSNSSVKSQGGASYVEVLQDISELDITQAGAGGVTSEILPVSKPIEVGLSNDTHTEIISGLDEGEYVVVRTVDAAASQAQQANSGFRLFGGPGAGGTRTR